MWYNVLSRIGYNVVKYQRTYYHREFRLIFEKTKSYKFEEEKWMAHNLYAQTTGKYLIDV